MTIYGVEDEIKMGNYRFQIEFDSGSGCGLAQRDIWVAERQPTETMALTDFSGEQLLAAYHGQSADIRQKEQQLIALRQHYKTLKSGERALLPYRQQRLEQKAQRKKVKTEIESFESALAAMLRSETRDAFDHEKLQSQINSFTENRHLRSFYFDEVSERYVQNFCHKYAIDPQYREDIQTGTAYWIERNALFERNLGRSLWRDRRQLLSFEEQDGKVRQFFRWIGQHYEAICALPDYQRIQQADNAFAPDIHEIDPEIRDAVVAWNALPGVCTRFSCQGVTGLVSYQEEMLLVPSYHEEFAYIDFTFLDEPVTVALDECLSHFPTIHLDPFSGIVPSGDTAPPKYHRLQSTGDNLTFRSDMVSLAYAVREYMRDKN